MTFPAVVGTPAETAVSTAGTSHVINLPSGAAGNLFLLIIDKGTPATTATFNALAGWTELLDENIASGLAIIYRLADGTEGATVTFTSSASIRSATIAYEISGAIDPAILAPQIGTTGTGTSATPNPPASAAPGSTQDYLFIAFYGAAGEEADDDTWSDTPPTNYTPTPPRQKSCGTAGTNLGGLIAAAERQLNTGSADNPGTFAKDVSAAWRSQTVMVTPAPTAAITGTVTASITEADVVTGGKTIIITLTNDTWIAAGAASFDLQRQNIINGLTSAQSETLGWNLVVKAGEAIGDVVRTSNTVVTITLGAHATYNITAQETITVTVPGTAVTSTASPVATPTFTVDTVSSFNPGWAARATQTIIGVS